MLTQIQPGQSDLDTTNEYTDDFDATHTVIKSLKMYPF